MPKELGSPGCCAGRFLQPLSRLASAEEAGLFFAGAKEDLMSIPLACNLVFLDPPYGKSLGEQALRSALANGWISKNALIVWEENATIIPPKGWDILDARSFGGTTISFLERS